MKKEHEWKTILFSNLLYVNYGLSVPFKQCLNILKCFCTKLFISTQAIKQHRGTYSKPYLREKTPDTSVSFQLSNIGSGIFNYGIMEVK